MGSGIDSRVTVTDPVLFYIPLSLCPVTPRAPLSLYPVPVPPYPLYPRTPLPRYPCTPFLE